MRRSLLPLALLLAAPLAPAAAQRSTPVVQANARDARVYRALEDSLLSIRSSSARATALRRVALAGDRADLLTVMRVARTVPSSTDRARLLGAIASRYLDGSDETLATAYLRTARTIPSSEELRDLVIDILPLVASSETRVLNVLETVGAMPSSRDRALVLTAIVQAGAVRSDAVRLRFAEAVRALPSERDRRQVARVAGGE